MPPATSTPRPPPPRPHRHPESQVLSGRDRSRAQVEDGPFGTSRNGMSLSCVISRGMPSTRSLRCCAPSRWCRHRCPTPGASGSRCPARRPTVVVGQAAAAWRPANSNAMMVTWRWRRRASNSRAIAAAVGEHAGARCPSADARRRAPRRRRRACSASPTRSRARGSSSRPVVARQLDERIAPRPAGPDRRRAARSRTASCRPWRCARGTSSGCRRSSPRRPRRPGRVSGTRTSVMNSWQNSVRAVDHLDAVHLDARLVDREDEHAEAAVLRHVPVGAGQARAPSRSTTRRWSRSSSR